MMVTVAAHEQCGPQFMRMHALWLQVCMVYAGCGVVNDESTNSYTIRGTMVQSFKLLTHSVTKHDTSLSMTNGIIDD